MHDSKYLFLNRWKLNQHLYALKRPLPTLNWCLDIVRHTVTKLFYLWRPWIMWLKFPFVSQTIAQMRGNLNVLEEQVSALKAKVERSALTPRKKEDTPRK